MLERVLEKNFKWKVKGEVVTKNDFQKKGRGVYSGI